MPTINLGVQRKRDVTYNKTLFQKVYQSSRWRLLRSAKFHECPLCEVCLKVGKVTPTDEIHHIIPFYNGVEVQEWLAFDYDNLVSLCIECHKKAHKLLSI